uniref:Aldedh domain-containing protein n=1 Tax=Trichuris muris TaxID=70415 RepID=A0A5S6QWR8_TRIMR
MFYPKIEPVKDIGIRHTQKLVHCYNAVNTQPPFGGYKHSGIGREHSIEGVREYCEVKTVCIHIDEEKTR